MQPCHSLGRVPRLAAPVLHCTCILLQAAWPVSLPAASASKARQWEPVTWQFTNPGVAGNPFDLVAQATFTHPDSGQSIRTQLFYAGKEVWNLRFTGTHPGRWRYRIESADPDLNGKEGMVEVEPNPGAPGMLTHYGSKWGWQGTGAVFVPQLVMYRDLPAFERNPARIDADIQTFLVEHGFNGFHIAVLCRWFNFDKTRSDEIEEPSPDPDPRTFEALELLLEKVHAAGGMVHIWAWGDEQRRMTPRRWGLNDEVDRRLQRYICARLGPVPGWSMGYGFDLQEWVEDEDLRSWHQYMHRHLGWPHLLGGRAPDLTQIWGGLDYSSYQQHRPDYSIYVRAIDQFPDKPTFLEDRFRVRRHVYPDKDYDFDMTRRGLWHSTLAGGAANIWGNLLDPRPDGMSHPYPNRQQILTWAKFWRNRFEQALVRDTRLSDGFCLKVPGQRLLVYREAADSIRMDLSELSGSIDAVAVDTCQPYQEIPVPRLEAGPNQLFRAPHRSDWALAVELRAAQ